MLHVYVNDASKADCTGFVGETFVIYAHEIDLCTAYCEKPLLKTICT